MLSIGILTSTRWIVKYWSGPMALLMICFRTSSECTICPFEMRDTDDGSAWKAGTAGRLNAFACGEITIGLTLLAFAFWANCDWMKVKLAADKFGAGYWCKASLRVAGTSFVFFMIDWILVAAADFSGLKTGTPSGNDWASVIACGVFLL